MRRYRKESGFTIIELMIIVMIIGVLVALVLPNMRSSAARARMTEAMLAFGPCRSLVTEIYSAAGDAPAANEWGCEVPSNASQYVDSVQTTADGTIKLSLKGFNDLRIDFHTLTLAPLDNTGNLPSGNGAPVTRWRCGNGPADGTDVPAQFLPSSCRG
jgi:type IV pilus assembly protein PilA